MSASQLFVGDKLGLYAALREMDGPCTAEDLAKATSLNVRWLREWLAQQAALGVVVLLDGDGDSDADLVYEFPQEFADVLADPNHAQYDIPLIQMVPALVARAKTMLPEAFKSGIGRSYDDKDISEAIDRAHARQIRDVVVPKVVPLTPAHAAMLLPGARVADLGCGGGNLLLALARRYSEASFEGFEISAAALATARFNVGAARDVKNATVVNANVRSLGDAGPFDVVVTFDVLHDSTDPAALIAQVRRALKPGGCWLLGDIACRDGVRSTLRDKNADAALLYGFSICLCMASALSQPNGAGLGTLGFTVPRAREMLAAGGFDKVRVVHEQDGTRWFEIIG